ncbi:MAG: DNA polymerase beta superfamily protein, partial [Baekduiaceae bacterium]
MTTETLHSLEPDPVRAREIAERGLILRTTVGSVVHGLSNPGTDDRDELGVCIEPPDYLLGTRRFEHFVYRTQPDGHPSGPGDLDLTVYGLRKFCGLAMKGSPTVLLPLYVEGEHLLVTSETGDRLRALAPEFVSRSTGRAFLGYLDAQRRGLVGERHATRTRERSRLHGYDTKYAMHALRIAHQGVELLTDGVITLPVAEPARRGLRAVRAGGVPLAAVL